MIAWPKVSKRTHWDAGAAEALIDALDALNSPFALSDNLGAMKFQTTGFERITRELGGQFATRVRDLACSVWALSSAGQKKAVKSIRVGCPKSAYELRATFMARDPFGMPAVLISATTICLDPLSEATLQERFGLTQAQTRVARLLAAGLRNHEIAGELSLSPHTIRHHVEHIRSKVGGHTRAAIGARLRHGPGEPA